MISEQVLEEVKNRLVATYNPLAIYLFGSYAWGTPDKESDLDLLVVVESSDEKSYKRAISGHQALFGLCISKDILVHTKEVFEKRSHDRTTLEYKIKHHGRMMYARA